MKFLAVSLLSLLILSGCSKKSTDNSGLAARVGDRVLTLEEVARNVPPGIESADSARIARNFVNNWVEEQSVTLMAEKMIPDTKEIEEMVAEYRRQLLMWEYRRQMTLKNGMPMHDEADINDYYEKHKNILKLTRPVIKGLYIKIASNAKELPEIKRLYRSTKINDMDKLEKLVDNAVNYEFFRDNWVEWGSVESRIPAKELEQNPDLFPVTHDHLEVTADGYTYLLDIDDVLKAGDTTPMDVARASIIEALDRENAVTYDKSLRRQLFDKAFREGIAEIFIEQ